MTPELFWLSATALLAASMWIPYIVGVNLHPASGHADGFTRPADLTGFPPWVHRAHRAHLNLIEQGLPFAVVVLVAAQAGVSTPVTALAAAAFFWLRVIHAVGMISGILTFPARPIVFTAGWLAILLIGWQILVA